MINHECSLNNYGDLSDFSDDLHLAVKSGTYKVDYHPETGRFTSALNTEAEINITYNYSGYYYETYKENGIRTFYGMSGIDSISVLEKMIFRIEEKYEKNGEWTISNRKETVYYDKNNNEVDWCDIVFNNAVYERKEEMEIEVSEGDTSDYWLATAANALKPLHQLIALA